MQFGLSESVRHWGRYRPDTIAVYSNGAGISYAELNTLVDALCARLLHDGFRSARVAVAIKSKVHTLIAYLAVLRLGRSIVLLNPALKDEAIRTNLLDTGADELIHDGAMSRWKDLFPSPPRALAVESVDWSKSVEYSGAAEADPHDEWGVLFSSGSTGTPKGVERDQYSMVTEFIGWCLELALSRWTTFYIGRPVFYTGGVVLVGSVLLVGGAVVLNDYSDNNDPFAAWKDYQAFARSRPVDWAFFVPDQLRAFMEYAANGIDASARAIVVMGAPITGHEKQKVRQVLRSEVVESWGNSESLGTITDPEDLDRRPDAVGRPFLTDEVVVVDDDGNSVPANTMGRIAGGEEAGFQGYSGRPDATKLVKQKALIISDDVGFLDEQGYLYVRGREQESFICGGKTFFVGELERGLANTVGVAALALVPLESDTGNARLLALIVPRIGDDRSPSTLQADLDRRLPPPVALDRVAVVDRIPHTPSGKVNRAECRKRALLST
ncbi:MAG: acyl--CoA ligase [Phycisphaerales bacterium]|nr:acyl--CoA ligase [Phycisphaerales bacterium]